MTTIVLTDLDGVHLQPPRECPPGVPLAVAAVNSRGEPSSYSTPKQLLMLNLLMHSGVVVPVTARESDSFKRVRLPFSGFAICAFGGTILTPDGTPEPRWHAHITQAAGEQKAYLAELKQLVDQEALRNGIAVRATIVGDAGNDLYLNCKHEARNLDELSQIATFVQARLSPAWSVHCNGNNLAFMPPFLGKDKAVRFFLTELAPPNSCVVGLGDSFTDLCFMELCDFVACPTKSQIFEFLGQALPSHATDTKGART